MRLSSIGGNYPLLEANFSRRSFLRGVSGLVSMGLKPLNAVSALSGGGGGYDVSKFAGLVKALPSDKIKLLSMFMFNALGEEAYIRGDDIRNTDFRPILSLERGKDGKLHYWSDDTCLTGWKPSLAKKIAFEGFYTQEGIIYYDSGEGNPIQIAPIECMIGLALGPKRINRINSDGFQTNDLIELLENASPEDVNKIAPGFIDDCISQIIGTEGKDVFLSGIKEFYDKIGYDGDCRDLLKASSIFRSLLDIPDNFDTATMVSKLVQHGFMGKSAAKRAVDVVKKYGDRMNQKIDLDELKAKQKTSNNLKRRFKVENEADIEKERQENQRLRDKEDADKKRSDNYDDYLKSQMSWESGIGESRNRLSKKRPLVHSARRNISNRYVI